MGQRREKQQFGRGPGAGELPADGNELIEFVRGLLRTANERTSLSFVYTLASASGYALQTKKETLRKFIREDGRGFDNKDDLARLAQVFTTTPVGSALVAPLHSDPLPKHGTEIRQSFFAELLGSTGSFDYSFYSRYLIYHSGFFEQSSYSIRFLKVHTDAITKQISFEDHKADRGPLRVMEGPAVFINYGVVRFFMGKPHFISIDPFSEVGMRLIIIDRKINEGDTKTLIGRMSGMTNAGNSYVKDVLLHRWDGNDGDGTFQSGNPSRSSLKAIHRARFTDLARMRPKDLPDPALDALLDGAA